MWSVFTIIAYFLLALIVPAVWMAMSVQRRTAGERRVVCPRDAMPSLVQLDSWHAVRMRALGNPEMLVARCSKWPRYAGCGQECRDEMTTRG